MVRIFGVLFIALYMFFMYFLGGAITNKQGSYSLQFMLGYITFSFFVAVGGIIIQILNLSWWIFVLYLIGVYVALAFYAIGRYALARIVPINPSKIIDFVREQWFLIVVAIILTTLSVSHLLWIWGNNASDDGYYLSLVGALPYSPNSFHMAPSQGFATSLKGVGTYILNTIYSEYSVYAFFTGMKASLFCRVYMSFFNYFLFGSCISALTEKVAKQFKFHISRQVYQYAVVITLFFAFTMFIMETRHLMHVYDDWQYNSAMYYGSSIVRMMSIFWVLVPFFDRDKIGIKDVFYVAAIALALLSKSTIALPLMIVIPFCYLVTLWIFSKNPSHWVLAVLLVIGYTTVSIFLGPREGIEGMIQQYFGYIKESVLFIPSLAIIAASCLTRNKYIIRYNATLLLILVFMVMKPFNHLFEVASVINFVAARALACWYYTLVATAFVYIVMGFYFVIRPEILRKIALIGAAGGLCMVLPYSDNVSYSEFFSKLGILSQNPDCMPASTVALGEVLEQRYHETGKINVVTMIDNNRPNGIIHYPNTVIRSVSPHTISLSAVPRFGGDTSGNYQTFGLESQNNFNYFIGNPVDDTYNVIANTFDETQCNVVIMSSEVGLNGYSYAPFLSRSGFELYKVVEDGQANIQFFVYTRNI